MGGGGGVSPLRGADLHQISCQRTLNSFHCTLLTSEKGFFIVNKLFSPLDVYFYGFNWPSFFFTFSKRLLDNLSWI